MRIVAGLVFISDEAAMRGWDGEGLVFTSRIPLQRETSGNRAGLEFCNLKDMQNF